MRVDDTPKAKSKNLDVLAEFERRKAKNAANFVVIGRYFTSSDVELY
jgi:elongation factor 1 alpha-like protein